MSDIMSEIPANVILAEEFAKQFDGFSIGSNDYKVSRDDVVYIEPNGDQPARLIISGSTAAVLDTHAKQLGITPQTLVMSMLYSAASSPGLIQICRYCRFCRPMKESLKKGEHLIPGEEDTFRCLKGRFDYEFKNGTKVHNSFAWSGVVKPNKSVAKAQKDCPYYYFIPSPDKSKVSGI